MKEKKSKVELKRLWTNATQINQFKNYKTLTDGEKRLFWVKRVVDLLVKAGKFKEFSKKGKLEFTANGVTVKLTLERLSVKGTEKNGKKVSYSLTFLVSSMNTAYYNATRLLRKALGV